MMNYAAPAYFIKKKPIAWERITFHGCFSISMLSVVYLLMTFATGKSWFPMISVATNPSELTLSLLQCVLGTAALFLPLLLQKITKIKMPDSLCAFFYLFILCSTVLGEVFSLYYRIPCWDSLLHFSSGIMIGMLGSILILDFVQRKKCSQLITPMMVAVSAVCFALCIGMFWEIYEFAADSLLGLNMQKFLLQDGTALIGKAALMDTMKDLIVDFAGALVAAVCAHASIKKQQGWLYRYMETTPTKAPRRLLPQSEVYPLAS